MDDVVQLLKVMNAILVLLFPLCVLAYASIIGLFIEKILKSFNSRKKGISKRGDT